MTCLLGIINNNKKINSHKFYLTPSIYTWRGRHNLSTRLCQEGQIDFFLSLIYMSETIADNHAKMLTYRKEKDYSNHANFF